MKSLPSILTSLSRLWSKNSHRPSRRERYDLEVSRGKDPLPSLSGVSCVMESWGVFLLPKVYEPQLVTGL